MYHLEYLEALRGLLHVGQQDSSPSRCLLRYEGLGYGGSGSSLLRHDADGPNDELLRPHERNRNGASFGMLITSNIVLGVLKVFGEVKGCVTLVVKIREEEIAFDFDLFSWGQMG